ncbi:MAG: transcription factor S [Candidatus Nezhaarchaeota archaeon]|nr:transcription factor S [Candidatus Nezhaarchaeota archaeon]
MTSNIPFCPKCGKLLSPLREGGTIRLVCKLCGYSEVPPLITKEIKVSQRISRPLQETTVIIKSELSKLMPSIKALCPKCGHNEAYWWLLQTRRADEGSTRFYRCVKCGYTWREYD